MQQRSNGMRITGQNYSSKSEACDEVHNDALYLNVQICDTKIKMTACCFMKHKDHGAVNWRRNYRMVQTLEAEPLWPPYVTKGVQITSALSVKVPAWAFNWVVSPVKTETIMVQHMVADLGSNCSKVGLLLIEGFVVRWGDEPLEEVIAAVWSGSSQMISVGKSSGMGPEATEVRPH